MRTLKISNLLHDDADEILKPGRLLNEVATLLGVPEWWNLANRDPFSGLLGYCDFQIEIVAIESRIEVSRITLELWDSYSGDAVPKRHKIKIAKGIKVDLCGYNPGASFEVVKDNLKVHQVAFSERFVNDASDVKAVINLSNGGRFVFFQMEGSLGLAEIHFIHRQSYDSQ